MLFQGLAVFTALLSVLIYVLWPSVDPRIEDSHLLHGVAFVMNIFASINDLLWYLGVKDIFILQRFFMKIMKRQISTDSNAFRTQEMSLNGTRAILYFPQNTEITSKHSIGAIVYFHGGGMVLGSPESHHGVVSELVASLNCIVVSVDYRLAPEFTAPAGFEDALRATEYVLRNGLQEWNVDTTRVILAGDSAGAHLALSVTLKLTSDDKYGDLPAPRAVALLYPPVQMLTFNTPSFIQNKDQVFYRRKECVYFRLAYYEGNTQEHFHDFYCNNHSSISTRVNLAKQFQLPELVNRGPSHLDADGDESLIQKFHHVYQDPMKSPIFGDLTKFPPTFVLSCEFDILRDDALMLVRRLKHEGREVSHMHLQSFHGMISFYKMYPPAMRALQTMQQFISQYI